MFQAIEAGGSTSGGTAIQEFAPLSNPFSHLVGTPKQYKASSPAEAISLYKEWILTRIENHEPTRLAVYELVRRELRGEHTVLACNCLPLSCHGTALKELVEQLAFLGVTKTVVVDEDGVLPF